MAHKRYYNKARKRVSSVTTVIGNSLGWSSNALIHRAWQLGIEGRNYREEWGLAARIGTAAHDMVECEIKGEAFDPLNHNLNTEDFEIALNCYKSWGRWKKKYKPDIIASEISFTSDLLQVGATIDVVALVDDKMTLADIKTSKAVYDSHLIQTAAYAHIWNECTGARKPIEQVWIIHLKKTGGYRCHKYTMEDLWDSFLAFTYLCKLQRKQKLIGELL